MVCEKCGEEGKPDKKQSNENWNVIPAVCKCGGRIIPKFK